MTTRLYPLQVVNRNVPNSCFIVADVSICSGEQHTTYYIDDQGYMWKVGDWTIDKPHFSSLSQLCRITGDTERMVNFRYEQWKEKQNELR